LSNGDACNTQGRQDHNKSDGRTFHLIKLH
jgi:hypothetical protein